MNTAYFYLTDEGGKLAHKLATAHPGDIYNKENFKENANQSIPSLVLWSLDLFLSRTYANLRVLDFYASNRRRNV